MEHTTFWFALMINYWQRALLVTSQKIDLEVDAEINKYIFKYREQVAGEECNVQDRWSPFESLAELKYLGKTPNKWKLHVCRN